MTYELRVRIGKATVHVRRYVLRNSAMKGLARARIALSGAADAEAHLYSATSVGLLRQSH